MKLKDYKISFLKCIIPMIYPLVLTLCVSLIFTMALGKEKNFMILPFLFMFYSFFLLFPLALGIHYFLFDYKKILVVDSVNKKILVQKNKKVILELKFQDIQKIIRVTSERRAFAEKLKKNKAPWNHFYYYQINSEKNKDVLITCLTKRNLEKILTDVDFEYVSVFVPFIKREPVLLESEDIDIRLNFKETLLKKSVSELEQNTNDYAFYTPDERNIMKKELLRRKLSTKTQHGV